jgi:RNA polymerase sigma factor (sigma-70 family)
MTTALRPQVFIVDDDVSVRTALTRLVGSVGHSVRAFSSAREFLDSQCYLHPGCLVLDVRLPDLDGMELHERLQAAGTPIPVIFMTGFGDIPTSVRAIKSGAVDFLPKPVSDDTLLRAIDTALAEEARQRADRVEVQELSRRFELLTPRERDVFRLVLAGRLNKQIARELGISEKTVKVHRGRVMSKMGARRVAQLVQFAARMGYIGTSARQEIRLNFDPAPVWPKRTPVTGDRLTVAPLSS